MVEDIAAYLSMFPDELSYLLARNGTNVPFRLIRHSLRPWENR